MLRNMATQRVTPRVPGALLWMLLLGNCSARAAEVLDQQVQLSNAYSVDFNYNQQLAQSFTVGTSGLISKLGVQIYRLNDGLDTSGSVRISLGTLFLPIFEYKTVEVPISDIPVISSFNDPVPWTYVDVTMGKQLAQPGDQFNIRVAESYSTPTVGETTVYWRASGNSVYSGGAMIRRVPPYPPSEFWANFADGDGGFQTFVQTSAAQHSATFSTQFDVQATSDGSQFVLHDGDTKINAAQAVPASPDSRGLLDFDLSSLPQNALLGQTYIELQISDFVPGSKETGFSALTVMGYASDGTPQVNDATAGVPLTFSQSISALGVVQLYLDVTKLDAIHPQGGHLGLTITGGHFSTGFYTSEQAAADPSFLAPTLHMSYITVPEPAGLYLGFASQVVTWGMFRRRLLPRDIELATTPSSKS